jgi:F0F1-type ATP synthase membrane subunit a
MLVGLGPFIIVFLLSGLEIGIAFIQAYAFCLLTSMYINDSLVLH